MATARVRMNLPDGWSGRRGQRGECWMKIEQEKELGKHNVSNERERMKQRATRNKTITLSGEEAVKFASRVLSPSAIAGTSFVNQTIHGDLMEVLALLPNQFADLIIIDPPYNLHKNFNGLKFRASSGKEYREYLNEWFGAVCRKLKPNGSLYLCGDWKCTSVLQQAMEGELTVLNRITWQREKGRGAKSNWKNGMEDIWFGVKDPDNYCFNVDAVKVKRRVLAPYKDHGEPKDWEESKDGKYRMTCPSNLWDDISIPYWSMAENTDHPTQKPEKLIAKLILASSNEGDMIFDPFLGSGTTSVVAKKLGRQYCGIETNLEYCCLAEKRLEMAENDLTIQGYRNGVFWERNTQRDQNLASQDV